VRKVLDVFMCSVYNGALFFLTIRKIVKKLVTTGVNVMNKTREYEMLVLSDPNVDEAKLNIVFDRLRDVCEKNGAEIKNINPWGKRRLAYEIKDLREGVYTLLDIDSVPSAIAKMESFMRIQTPVLRFLTTRKGE
jgi:small subunit ribosomal protein S6